MNFKLTLQYDGSRYKGWQRLGQDEETIQGKIEHVLSRLEGEPVEIVGSSRTDAGVHALGQVVSVKLTKVKSAADLKHDLNHALPQDMAVVEVTDVPERFHARYQAKGKTYLYQIWNAEHVQPFLRKYSMHVEQPLALDRMRAAASELTGTHDFTAYSNVKSKKKTTVRTIDMITVTEKEGLIAIRLHGNGFLYNMARKMVGTLIDAGLGTIEPATIPAILEAQDRSCTGRLAEARGLFLESVDF